MCCGRPGALVALQYFGLDPTAALAGLGIGGIAVALAAQKTLENVIGGLSLIFDKAVRVGDLLKLGDAAGTGRRFDRTAIHQDSHDATHDPERAERSDCQRDARDAVGTRHVLVSSHAGPAVRDDMRRRSAGSSTGFATRSRRILRRYETIRVRLFRFGPSSLDVEAVRVCC